LKFFGEGIMIVVPGKLYENLRGFKAYIFVGDKYSEIIYQRWNFFLFLEEREGDAKRARGWYFLDSNGKKVFVISLWAPDFVEVRTMS